jgi:hypothetical protein
VSDSLTLRMLAVRGEDASPVVTVTFRHLPDYPRLALSAAYAPQYAAAGDDTLIDGLRGNESFRTGRWQGYRGHDLDVTLDFGEAREIRQVAMGFLQDTGSWIFMPRRVIVEASADGRSFSPLGTVENVVPEDAPNAVIQDFVLDLARPHRARHLRLRVVQYGKLPAWHPGAGEDAWLFSDEVVVR